ncbi:hypothetical protein TSAR_010356 [Trichomalopsis sarcophagae]|uniref:Uncharacterized protein n=1 Tax=Trichomalopsis sarcophagae TaxID=543379 RepID=A0A232F937_9HYME|nr:hypothetical protein TSAR_010356 [Trichomalopsis sarcophagae]
MNLQNAVVLQDDAESTDLEHSVVGFGADFCIHFILDGTQLRFKISNTGFLQLNYDIMEEGIYNFCAQLNNERRIQSSNLRCAVKQIVSKTGINVFYVYGAGILSGTCEKLTKFTIKTTEKIYNPDLSKRLQISIIDPNRHILSKNVIIKSAQEGIIQVDYTPIIPGEHDVLFILDSVKIWKSPFKVIVKYDGVESEKCFDVEIKFRLSHTIRRDHISQYVVLLTNENRIYHGKLILKPDGSVNVAFIPQSERIHHVYVMKNSSMIQVNPVMSIDVNKSMLAQAHKVLITGQATEVGYTNEDNEFDVDFTTAGYGQLCVRMTGPCKANIKIQPSEEKCAKVTYKVALEGKYCLEIFYSSKLVAAFPKIVSITNRCNPRTSYATVLKSLLNRF